MRLHSFLLKSLLIFFLPSSLLAQSASVHFQVNLSYYIDEGKFDPLNEFIDVAGSFNGWGSTVQQLSDADSDSVYSLTVSGFTVGQSFEFKFRINGEWAGREEFPGGGGNRSFTVSKASDSLYVWYNDEEPDTGSPVAAFTASPTETSVGRSVFFSSQSSGLITDFEWTFEGGSPSSSTQENVVVSYETPGIYDVKLKVYNANEADSLIQADFITITEAEDPPPSGDKPDWQNAVFYEVFVRSFYDSDADGVGDFFGLTQKLDYLQDLGITGIWLMPINPSPSYHGYDVTDYYGINPDYGSLDDFKTFLDEAHKRGMLVIMDLVLNHSSSSHPWFRASSDGDETYRDFYRWSESNPNQTGPWGQQVWHQRNGDYYFGLFWSEMPDLNYHHEPAKDSMFAVTDYWLEEIGVDGFRLDAAIHVFEDGNEMENVPETFQFWKDFRSHTKAINPTMFNVGEAWTSTENVLKYLDEGLDYAFEFDLAYSIVNAVNSGNTSSLMQKINSVFSVYPDNRVGVFLRNHDQPRVMNEVALDVRKAKAAATVYLTLPGIPYLYYGEEIGMIGTKPDEDIRRPMQWNDGPHAGFTTGNPWRPPHSSYTTYNVEQQMASDTSLYTHYKRLIEFKNWVQPQTIIPANVSSSKVLAYFTENEEKFTGLGITLVNTSSDSVKGVSLDFPESLLAKYNPECSHEYLNQTGGCGYVGKQSSGVFDFANFDLAPYQSLVFGVDKIFNSSEEEVILPTQTTLLPAYPNPFNPTTTIRFDLESTQNIDLSVYSLVGQKVATLEYGARTAGSHSVVWDAQNLASGTYLIRLQTQGKVLTQKVMLVK